MGKVISLLNTKSHSDLDAFKTKGGFLDPKIKCEEMEKNIGRKMTFAVRPGQGTSHRGVFHVGSIQKIYDGSLAYRVYGENDTFGRPATPNDVIWL